MTLKKSPQNMSIHKSPAIMRVLDAQPNHPASGRLSMVCERYRHICLTSLPELTDTELMMIGNALSGTFIDPLTVDNLHNDIADERDDEHPNDPLPDYLALAEKIKTWNTAQKYAVLEQLKL